MKRSKRKPKELWRKKQKNKFNGQKEKVHYTLKIKRDLLDKEKGLIRQERNGK